MQRVCDKCGGAGTGTARFELCDVCGGAGVIGTHTKWGHRVLPTGVHLRPQEASGDTCVGCYFKAEAYDKCERPKALQPEFVCVDFPGFGKPCPVIWVEAELDPRDVMPE